MSRNAFPIFMLKEINKTTPLEAEEKSEECNSLVVAYSRDLNLKSKESTSVPENIYNAVLEVELA